MISILDWPMVGYQGSRTMVAGGKLKNLRKVDYSRSRKAYRAVISLISPSRQTKSGVTYLTTASTMPKLFISYRREDSQDIAGRIYDRLTRHFGNDKVFIDVDTIPYGVDFRQYLSGWVGSCNVVLVVIGRCWLDACHENGPRSGERRLDDPTDFVRIEITAALARGIPVIPILVSGATMPPADRLPAEMSDLAFRHAADVHSGRDFHGHMNRLIEALERLTKPILRSELASGDNVTARKQTAVQSRTQHAAAIEVDRPAVAWPTNLSFDGPDAEGLPFGWFDGLDYVSRVSTEYEVKVLPRSIYECRCVQLYRKQAKPKEFGTLMQRCPAQMFIGKVVRLEAELRTDNVDGSAGLWLRIDGPSGHLFFDNMRDRPIRGSTPWSKYTIETVVSDEAVWLNYGILLVGNGSLCADNFNLEVRDADHESIGMDKVIH